MLFTAASHSSSFTQYGIIHGRCDSPIGWNALLCMCWYIVTKSEVLSGSRIDEFIWGHSTKGITVEQEQSADFFTGVCYAARQCFLITVLLHKN